jgi:nucleoside-diphosphate kinase
MSKYFLLALLALSALSAEQTLAVIKPDAVQAKHIGAILDKYESANLRIAGLKMTKLTPEQAGEFYAVHKDRPFYPELVAFFSSGPVVAIVLDGDNAVAKNREIMGATNPAQAAPGTLRKLFAESVTRNAVHGSDSAENAQKEIAFFFKPSEIN